MRTRIRTRSIAQPAAWRRIRAAMGGAGTLLMLAPSQGLGGGIERVADAIQAAWPDRVERVDLRAAGPRRVTSTPLAQQVRFTISAAAMALRRRPSVVLALHVNLLPVAYLAARTTRSRLGLWAHGIEVWGRLGAVRRRL